MNSTFSETTSYKKEFPNKAIPHTQNLKPIDAIIATKSFPGQFESTSKREYCTPGKKRNCPILEYSGVNNIIKNSTLYLDPLKHKYFY